MGAIGTARLPPLRGSLRPAVCRSMNHGRPRVFDDTPVEKRSEPMRGELWAEMVPRRPDVHVCARVFEQCIPQSGFRKTFPSRRATGTNNSKRPIGWWSTPLMQYLCCILFTVRLHSVLCACGLKLHTLLCFNCVRLWSIDQLPKWL